MYSFAQADEILTVLQGGLPADFDLIQVLLESPWPSDSEGYEKEMELRREMFTKMLALHIDPPALDRAAGVSVFKPDLFEACVLITKGECCLPRLMTRIVREKLTKDDVSRLLVKVWAEATKERDYREYLVVDPDDFRGNELLVSLPIIEEVPHQEEAKSSGSNRNAPPVENPNTSEETIYRDLSDHGVLINAMANELSDQQNPVPKSPIPNVDLSQMQDALQQLRDAAPDGLTPLERAQERVRNPASEDYYKYYVTTEDEMSDWDDDLNSTLDAHESEPEPNPRTKAFRDYGGQRPLPETDDRRRFTVSEAFHGAQELRNKLLLAQLSTVASLAEYPTAKAKASKPPPIINYKLEADALAVLKKPRRELTKEDTRKINRWVQDRLLHATHIHPDINVDMIMDRTTIILGAGEYGVVYSTIRYAILMLQTRDRKLVDIPLDPKSARELVQACNQVSSQVGMTSLTTVIGDTIDYIHAVSSDMQARNATPILEVKQVAEVLSRTLSSHVATLSSLMRTIESVVKSATGQPTAELAKGVARAPSNKRFNARSLSATSRRSQPSRSDAASIINDIDEYDLTLPPADVEASDRTDRDSEIASNLDLEEASALFNAYYK